MNQELAKTINAAAVMVYMDLKGLSNATIQDHKTVNQYSKGQIQTASEYVEASNAEDKSTITVCLSPSKVDAVKGYSAKMY